MLVAVFFLSGCAIALQDQVSYTAAKPYDEAIPKVQKKIMLMIPVIYKEGTENYKETVSGNVQTKTWTTYYYPDVAAPYNLFMPFNYLKGYADINFSYLADNFNINDLKKGVLYRNSEGDSDYLAIRDLFYDEADSIYWVMKNKDEKTKYRVNTKRPEGYDYYFTFSHHRKRENGFPSETLTILSLGLIPSWSYYDVDYYLTVEDSGGRKTVFSNSSQVYRQMTSMLFLPTFGLLDNKTYYFGPQAEKNMRNLIDAAFTRYREKGDFF